MAQAQSMVRNRRTAGIASLCAAVFAALSVLIFVHACSPVTQSALILKEPLVPRFDPENEVFTSFDGSQLGLTVWDTEGEPEIVVVGLHGMNDWANAFFMAAPWWAERGVKTYAFDQRGFGRSPGRGLWPEEELMREDLRTAVAVARSRHPNAKLAVVGISMGAAVAMSAFGSDDPPDADVLLLSGPGLRGWGALPLAYRPSLWISARVRPGWIVVPPKGVKIEPTDNVEMLREIWSSPMMTRSNRIDQVHGVVSLMESAHRAAPDLPASVPSLLTYGAKDIVIPPNAMARTAGVLPEHVRTLYYEQGYHMLMRDLQAPTVWADMLAFMQDHTRPPPSDAPELPWLEDRRAQLTKSSPEG